MRLALAALIATLLATPLFAFTAHPACAQTALRLNEIMAGPARDWNGDGVYSSRDDEWVEVVNTSAATLDVSSFLLTDADSIARYGFAGSLAGGEHLVVTGKLSLDWERANGKPANGLSLANSGDSVLLWQVVGPDTVLVDGYTFKAHEAAADRASGRVPDGTGTWTLFDGLDPYTGSLVPPGTGCVPTPAQVNVCSQTPALPASWGRVKSLYR